MARLTNANEIIHRKSLSLLDIIHVDLEFTTIFCDKLICFLVLLRPLFQVFSSRVPFYNSINMPDTAQYKLESKIIEIISALFISMNVYSSYG